MRRINYSTRRINISKSPASIKVYQTVTLYLTSRGTVLLRDDKFLECFELIHNVFLSELEMEMGGIVEALTKSEEKRKWFSMCEALALILFCNCDHFVCVVAASEWLATQRVKDYEELCTEYIKVVLPSPNVNGEQGVWPATHVYEHFGMRLAQHRRYDLPDMHLYTI